MVAWHNQTFSQNGHFNFICNMIPLTSSLCNPFWISLISLPNPKLQVFLSGSLASGIICVAEKISLKNPLKKIVRPIFVYCFNTIATNISFLAMVLKLATNIDQYVYDLLWKFFIKIFSVIKFIGFLSCPIYNLDFREISSRLSEIQ